MPDGIRVVLVDDNEPSLYVKKHFLDRAGFDVVTASTGREALQLVMETEPDLVVLDVRLPDISGLEVCREIKKRNASLLVLQTSATYVRGPDRALGLDSGADAYLTEPIEADELIATINALLRMRRAENELRRLNETLEQRVAQRTAQLAEANRQLIAEMQDRHKAEEALRHAQKMEAVGQLTGGIAHDFNNLLTVIYGGLGTIQRRIPKDDERLTRAIEHCQLAAKRAGALTHRLLAFARRQPLEPKPVDPNRLISGIHEMMRRTLGERVLIKTVLADDAWRVEADPNQLENALLNLAVNARDAMPDGGVLQIETANTILDDIETRADLDLAPGEYATIAVSDSGQGMEPDIVERAFEPFFTTKAAGEGTGLGLSQVYGFVKQSGGDVTINSRPGVGTTVRIFLPRLRRACIEPALAAAPSVQPMPKELVVLVVEDDDAVRTYSVEALRELGYDVLEATNAETALRRMQEQPGIGLLFTDVGLPGSRNGRELAEEACKLAPGLRVLFTTGYARDAIVRDGRLAPGVQLIAKPFTYADLAAKLRMVMEAEAPVA